MRFFLWIIIYSGEYLLVYLACFLGVFSSDFLSCFTLFTLSVTVFDSIPWYVVILSSCQVLALLFHKHFLLFLTIKLPENLFWAIRSNKAVLIKILNMRDECFDLCVSSRYYAIVEAIITLIVVHITTN